MAIGVISTIKPHSTININQTIYRQGRRLKPDLFRLASFRQWKTNTKCNVSPAVLAKVGFSYTGKGDKVRCDACGLEIDSWKPGMDPRQIHMERKPKCPFVIDEKELFAKNDQVVSCLKPTIPSFVIEKSDYRGSMDHGGGNNLSEKNNENLFIDTLSTETIDRARSYTLSNWPSITPSAQEMAYAGWWYTNIADRVICIHCDAMFHNWCETDRPYEIHRLKSPHCYYVRATEKRAIANQRDSTVPTINPTINDAPNGQNIVGAVHADYAVVIRRHHTFESLSEEVRSLLPSVDSFVEAGFFYTGEKTIVRCFYCNGALRNWQSSDDPKIEHARWFPQCAYIRQYIGENLYQAIQRKNRELRAQQNYLENNNGEGQKYVPWTNDEIDRMVKARLDLPVVEKLRQEGYTMAIIRKVYEMQLRFKKDDFKTDVDLRVACLILDKQVKLINGKESNILVPQNWMKKYVEDQEIRPEVRPEQQQEQQEQQSISELNSSLELQKIQVKKTIETNPVRPKSITKTEEQLPCVLCLTTERQVACLPCGHLTSCVACGHSLKTCPICRAVVKAFIRIYT